MNRNSPSNQIEGATEASKTHNQVIKELQHLPEETSWDGLRKEG